MDTDGADEQMAAANAERLAVMEQIETRGVQRLCGVALFSAHDVAARGASELLRRLHRSRRRRSLDALLLRAYEPLLFRALAAPNNRVRERAIALLGDAFPLLDPRAPAATTDAALQTQLDALETLLGDAAPSVRVRAIRAAGRWLSHYWEMLPRQVHNDLLRALLHLSHDGAAPAVRAAVCDALAFVLPQHLAAPMLKKVLPLLKHLCDDRAAAVRLAFVRLMLAVKPIKAIKFYNCVPPDRLLARLATNETAKVRAAIAELLQQTFFAHQKPAKQQIERAVYLVHNNPRAAPVFFAHNASAVGSSASGECFGAPRRLAFNSLALGTSALDWLHDSSAGSRIGTRARCARRVGRL